LFDGELIEGHIAVERVDHPISPPPHRARSVVLVSIGVCVPSGIQPRHCHVFTIASRLQQTINNTFVGLVRVVSKERIHFGKRWRQTGQVKADSLW
jgi:hypothetical protein